MSFSAARATDPGRSANTESHPSMPSEQETPTTTQSRSDEAIYASRILIVDDEDTSLVLLRTILHNAGYSNIVCACSASEVTTFCEKEAPDLVLLDLILPGRDGFEILADLAPLREQEHLPVLVITGDAMPETKYRALAAGAREFVSKPYNAMEVLLRVHNMLEAVHLHRTLREHNNELERRVRERTQELEQTNLILQCSEAELQASQVEILERLAQAAEFRDDDTGQHTHRVGDTAAHIAQALGWKPARVELLRLAAPLHDVGKIGVPDNILLKPGRLTPVEFAQVKQHPAIGARLLQNGRSPLIHFAQSIALTHHERFDGLGYPRQLAADLIPVEGRIVAIADVFDALTHKRPYKPAWTIEAAVAEIQKGAGTQFDPRLVNAFLEVVPPIAAL